jgi:hypothetical protein
VKKTVKVVREYQIEVDGRDGNFCDPRCPGKNCNYEGFCRLFNDVLKYPVVDEKLLLTGHLVGRMQRLRCQECLNSEKKEVVEFSPSNSYKPYDVVFKSDLECVVIFDENIVGHKINLGIYKKSFVKRILLIMEKRKAKFNRSKLTKALKEKLVLRRKQL